MESMAVWSLLVQRRQLQDTTKWNWERESKRIFQLLGSQVPQEILTVGRTENFRHSQTTLPLERTTLTSLGHEIHYTGTVSYIVVGQWNWKMGGLHFRISLVQQHNQLEIIPSDWTIINAVAH